MYYGKKYGTDKSLFFQNADIFVFPTFYPNECFPLVLLEAMEQSLPCISTNEGGITDIIENGITGYVVERNNAEALATKIEYLFLHKEERESMGRMGRDKYEQRFTRERFEQQLLSIMQTLL